MILAITFISMMDETAFNLALKCYYGKCIQKEAKRISNKDRPSSMKFNRTKTRLSHVIKLIVLIIMGVYTIFFMYRQSTGAYLQTDIIIQFDESTSLSTYNGCYKMEKS